MSLEKKVAKLLIKKRKTLSSAESCSGGLLAHRLTNIPGSSNFFKLGLVVYAHHAKVKLLHIPKLTLQSRGAVSPDVALIMAKSVRKIVKSDYGVGITGIAGPTGATKNKPVGLVYVAVSSHNKTICKKFLFKGKRAAIKSSAAASALRLLLKFL